MNDLVAAWCGGVVGASGDNYGQQSAPAGKALVNDKKRLAAKPQLLYVATPSQG
jgi:hypothetical protein